MHGECKLCKRYCKLQESHFIPKFVGKWLKKTSITGYIRESNVIHKRRQDIEKEYWLCGDCEKLFSSWETKFSTHIFFPVLEDNQSTLQYSEWMAKFCASLSWRTVTYIRSKNSERNEDSFYVNSLNGAEEHLAGFLLGREKNLGKYEQHLFPLEEIESTTLENLPPNINRYFLRALGMDILKNRYGIFIYTKLPKFLLLGSVNYKKLSNMRSSRISMKKGKISPRKYHWPTGIAEYIFDKANEIANALEKIPSEQRTKFGEAIRKNPDKAAKSKLFEAFLADYRMFGKEVFK